MKIVSIDSKYLEKILERFPKYPNHGEGVLIFFSGCHYFIPLTSKLKKEIDQINMYFVFGDKKTKGTLLIKNYFPCNPSLITKENKSQAANFQLKELNERKEEIERKIRYQQIDQKKSNLHYHKELLYENYVERNTDRAKKFNFAKKYMDRAIQALVALEKLTNYQEKTDEILQCEVFSRILVIDEAETILRLKQAWINLKADLLKKQLTLNYIFELHRVVASHQALTSGELRKQPNAVSRKFIIPPPQKKIIVKKIENLEFKKGPKIVNLALELFYSIIIHQWFYDGNKRTAFLVLNKILIENDFGILMVEEKYQKRFNELLYSCYEANYNKTLDLKLKVKCQNDLFNFLIQNCFIKLS